jgi:hypothetical protein
LLDYYIYIYHKVAMKTLSFNALLLVGSLAATGGQTHRVRSVTSVGVLFSQDSLCGYYRGTSFTKQAQLGVCYAVPDSMPDIQTLQLLNWTTGSDHCDLWTSTDCSGTPSPQGPYGLGSGIASVYGPPGKEFAICGSVGGSNYIKGYQCYSEEDGTNPYA